MARSLLLLLYFIFLCFLPGIFSSQFVTLKSIQIFNAHEWLTGEPSIYFRCQGENKTILPDVKKTHVLYTFKGEESWQPLTELLDKKCKRCGLYEKDSIKSDDIFDEWEFCPDDFMTSDGKYERFKDKEFNATFSCPRCKPLEPNPIKSPSAKNWASDKGMYLILAIAIGIVSSVIVFGVVAWYKYCQRKKREKDQARFLKLFEEGDDIEDELGIGHYY